MSFWEGFLNPNSSYEECLTYFDHQFKTWPSEAFFQKPLNDTAKIKTWFSLDKNEITAIEIVIIEAAEIFSHHDFNPENRYNTVPQSYSLLVKWLFDCKYLNLPEEIYSHELNLDHSDILTFTQAHLKNHIWDTQIKDIPYLRSFLFRISSNNPVENQHGEKINFYIKNLYIKVSGNWEEHQEIYNRDFTQAKDFERSIFLNPTQSHEFLAVLTEYFILFAQLTKEE